MFAGVSLSLSPNAAFSTFSAVATTAGSLMTALVPSPMLISGGGASDIAATAFAVRSIPASILARTSGLKLRMVPSTTASSGMMFPAVPEWIEPMLIDAKFSRVLFAADHALHVDDKARRHHHRIDRAAAASRRDRRGRGI